MHSSTSSQEWHTAQHKLLHIFDPHFRPKNALASVNNLYAMTTCDKRQRCFSGSACAGVAATVVNDAVMVPADVIKQRLQVSRGQYKGVLDCITQTWRHEGLTAFYRQERSWVVVDRPAELLSGWPWLVTSGMQALTSSISRD